MWMRRFVAMFTLNQNMSRVCIRKGKKEEKKSKSTLIHAPWFVLTWFARYQFLKVRLVWCLSDLIRSIKCKAVHLWSMIKLRVIYLWDCSTTILQEWSGAVRGRGRPIISCHHGGGPSDHHLQGCHLPPKGHVRGQLPATTSHSVQHAHFPAPSPGLSQDQDLQLSRSGRPGQQVCPA